MYRRQRNPLVVIAVVISIVLVLVEIALFNTFFFGYRHQHSVDNSLNIDNPSEKTFYVSVDGRTFKVVPHAYLDHIPLAGRFFSNDKHHLVIRDERQQVLEDTMSVIHGTYMVLNPSRSVYVFWDLHYGSTPAPERTMTVLGREMTADFHLDSGLLVNNIEPETSMEEVWFNREVSYTHDNSLTDVSHKVMRAQDFIAWQDFMNGFNGLAIGARADLRNKIVEWFNTFAGQNIADYYGSDPTSQAVRKINSGFYDEEEVADLIIQSRDHSGSTRDQLAESVQSQKTLLETAKQIAPSTTGSPTLSPMLHVQYSYVSDRHWLVRKYFVVITAVEEYDAESHVMKSSSHPDYPEGRQ